MKKFLQSFWGSVRQYVITAFTLERAPMLNSLRITAVTVFPIVVGLLFRRSDLGMMGFLGGLYAILADVGGAYRTRAFSMGVATIGISLAAFVGTIVGWNVWLAAPLMFLCAFSCSMFSMWGTIGSKIGFVIIGIFMIVSGQPASFVLATERWVSFMCGGGWAILLTLWLWPWQPWQPQRNALAAYYSALGDFIDRACYIHPVMPDVQTEMVRWNEEISTERLRVHSAHDLAHRFVAASSEQREYPNPLNQLFLMLTFSGDRLFEATITLAESIEIARTKLHNTAMARSISESVMALSSLVQMLSGAIKEGDELDEEAMAKSLSQLVSLEVLMYKTLKAAPLKYETVAAFRNVLRLQRHVVEEIKTARGYVAQLNSDLPSTRAIRREVSAAYKPSVVWSAFKKTSSTSIVLLRDNLTARSLIFRHALRLAISTSLMVAFYVPLRIPNGYWIPLTILFILKPDYGGTHTRAIQRVIGTVLGGVAATFLVAAVHNEYLLIFILLMIGFFTFAHISGDYGIYVVFLTLFVLVMMDISTHTTWEMSLIRIGNTLLGGVVALLFGYLFWPQWELQRLPHQLARTLTANRAFFHSVMAAYLDPSLVQNTAGYWEVMQQAGREAQIETSNAAAAFQRLVSEPRAKRGDGERFYALVIYNQHFHDRITALETHLRTYEKLSTLPELELESFVDLTEEMLRRLELAVLNGSQMVQITRLGESLQEVQDTFRHMLEQPVVVDADANKQLNPLDTAHQEAVRAVTFVDSQVNRLAHDVAGMASADLHS